MRDDATQPPLLYAAAHKSYASYAFAILYMEYLVMLLTYYKICYQNNIDDANICSTIQQLHCHTKLCLQTRLHVSPFYPTYISSC